jgi:uncharacterized membrane protein/mono/diheme cytochrome c family protein
MTLDPAWLVVLGQAELSPLVQTFGRMHVAMVHFPIALLMLAGVLEAWRLARRRKEISPTVVTCALIGAGATVLAAAMGWILAEAGSFEEKELALHRWAGVVTAGVAVVTAVLLLIGQRRPGAMRAFTVGALTCSALVGMTGHFGGELTYGEGYLTALLFPEDEEGSGEEVSNEQAQSEEGEVEMVALAAGEKVSFEKHVKPILQATCVECHGADKVRGGLRLDTGAGILKGGKDGTVLVAHDPDKSQIVRRVLGLDGKKRMPIDKPALKPEQIEILKAWVAAGGNVGDVVAERTWVARLEPRQVELPPAVGGATNPVDRIVGKYLADKKVKVSGEVVEDRVFARRAYLDGVGMLPTVEELAAFEGDTGPGKRERLVDKLLGDSRRYAEHWMSFWNDALRNDYTGPGYIDGGRKQITAWLYKALRDGKPYDQFVTELVAPTPESEGFAKGIIWRGAVSASQVPELQVAQNISQVFLGINMKCASCHDSFINEWKLADAYGLANVYAEKPLNLFRCEVDLGKTAETKFLYPQLGSIDAAAPKAERLKQLARALTSKEDGRFARTIVNRLWAQLMGRGIVEPLDEMDHEPWSEDLLDWLAWDLAENGWDLKRTLRVIMTSRAYQMPSAGMADPNESGYAFTGPVVKRVTAEQFVDAVSQLTGVWTKSPSARPPEDVVLAGRWVWDRPGALKKAPAGTVYFRKEFTLDYPPTAVMGAVSCDNQYVMFVNGKRAMAGKEWQKPDVKNLVKLLKPGRNVIAIEAINDPAAVPPAASVATTQASTRATTGPATAAVAAATKPAGDTSNPAALWATLSIRVGEGKASKIVEIGTDETWSVSTKRPAKAWANVGFDVSDWGKAANLGAAADHYNLVANLTATNKQYTLREGKYRAVWARNDRLMTALGRPNREQTVTYRPSAATTLQMLELTNGPDLFDRLKEGAKRWMNEGTMSDRERVGRIYEAALGRGPTEREMGVAEQVVGKPATEEGLADLLWSVVMLPEFQLVY